MFCAWFIARRMFHSRNYGDLSFMENRFVNEYPNFSFKHLIADSAGHGALFLSRNEDRLGLFLVDRNDAMLLDEQSIRRISFAGPELNIQFRNWLKLPAVLLIDDDAEIQLIERVMAKFMAE